MNRIPHATWRQLPDEVLQIIDESCYLPASIKSGLSARRRTWVIRNIPQTAVVIVIRYPSAGLFKVEMEDRYHKLWLVWEVERQGNGCSVKMTVKADKHEKLEMYNERRKYVRFSDFAFGIVGKLDSSRVYTAQTMRVFLRNFGGRINFGNKMRNVRDLLIFAAKTSSFKKVAKNFERPPQRLFLHADGGLGKQNLRIASSLFTKNRVKEIHFGPHGLIQCIALSSDDQPPLRDNEGLLTEDGFKKMVRELEISYDGSPLPFEQGFRLKRTFVNLEPEEERLVEVNQKMRIVHTRDHVTAFLGSEEEADDANI